MYYSLIRFEKKNYIDISLFSNVKIERSIFKVEESFINEIRRSLEKNIIKIIKRSVSNDSNDHEKKKKIQNQFR